MHTIEIKKKRGFADEVPQSLISALPYRLVDEINRKYTSGRIEEIRLRRNRCASLTLNGENMVLETALDGREIDSALSGICSGSLYAYSDTINRGYISLPGGIRIGICGKAACEGERMIGVHEVSSLVVRIPHAAKRIGQPICRLLESFQR